MSVTLMVLGGLEGGRNLCDCVRARCAGDGRTAGRGQRKRPARRSLDSPLQPAAGRPAHVARQFAGPKNRTPPPDELTAEARGRAKE